MASRGHNHRNFCPCGFCTGTPKFKYTDTRERFREQWSDNYFKNARTCKYCGKPIRFKRFPNGGIGVFNFDAKGDRHPCNIKPAEYRLFNKLGVPTLKNILSEFEKNGWLPLFDVVLSTNIFGNCIEGKVMDFPHHRHFIIDDAFNPDPIELIYFRPVRGEPKLHELRFFDLISESLVIVRSAG